jgi:hypothetical protein
MSIKIKDFKEIPDGIELDPSLINKGQSDPTQPTNVEKQFVYEVYDKIAPHFSNTRYKPWPQVVKFLESLPQGILIYLSNIKAHYYVILVVETESIWDATKIFLH